MLRSPRFPHVATVCVHRPTPEENETDNASSHLRCLPRTQIFPKSTQATHRTPPSSLLRVGFSRPSFLACAYSFRSFSCLFAFFRRDSCDVWLPAVRFEIRARVHWRNVQFPESPNVFCHSQCAALSGITSDTNPNTILNNIVASALRYQSGGKSSSRNA